MHIPTSLHFIVLSTLFSIVILHNQVSPVSANYLETGGTNYAVYDLGNYYDNPSDTTYLQPDSTPGGLKTVIGSYDQNPDRVKNDIQAMCNQGQKKISLMIWFANFPSGMDLNTSYGGMVSSNLSTLSTRHKNNLTQVLDLIIKTKRSNDQPCYNELQFRFAPYSNAAAVGWSSWNETQYLQNKSFIFSTRDLVKSKLQGTNIKTYFDLGAEEGGRQEGQNQAYAERLWRDYLAIYGKSDTYGYSIALAPNRFVQSLTVYDRVGIRPDQYAVDIYDLPGTGMLPQMSQLKNEMQVWGEHTKQIIIQETYHTDSRVQTELTEAINNYGLNIRTIMQWQATREGIMTSSGTLRHYSTLSPTYIYTGTTKPGDLNDDGSVNLIDFNLLITNFGNPYTILDFNSIISNFGK